MIDRIALAGPFASGKTTVARRIMDVSGRHEIVGFAAPIYEIAALHVDSLKNEEVLGEWISRNLVWVLFNEDDSEMLFDRIRDVFEFTPVIEGKNRTLLQRIGDAGRTVDPDLWIDFWRVRVDEVGKSGRGILNDNLRYLNECEVSERMDFTIVYLDVSPEVQRERYRAMYGYEPTEAQLNHASERDLPLIRERAHHIVDNDGTQESLFARIDEMLRLREASE